MPNIQKEDSKVYFAQLKVENVVKLFDAAGFNNIISPEKFIALKLHFGEPGNTAYLKPEFVEPLAQDLIQKGAFPFLTDTNTLYKGQRTDAYHHILTAQKHGYNFCPTIIADGLKGYDFEKIEIQKKHFKEVFLGRAICQADSLVALTHFKGHEVTGFGGAIKNLSMGCASRAGKQQMHADIKPNIKKEKCTACEVCVAACPVKALAIKNKVAQADHNICIGCGQCVVVCPFNAISIDWSGSPDSVQEKMAEYALGVVQQKKGQVIFINFLNNISSNCDCYDFNDEPIVPDIGILASWDPVAIDQASVDLVNQTEGRIKSRNKFRALWPNTDWSIQLSYAEKIGLGKRKYALIKI